MSLQTNELFSSAAGAGSGLRVEPRTIQVKTFASGSGTLAKLTPVAFNRSTGFWSVWTGNGSEVTTITAAATPATAGTFTLTVEGHVTGTIAFDATAQAIEDALLNAGIGGPEDVSVAITVGVDLGDANAVATITFAGDLADRALTITADFTGLTGNVHVLAESQAGTPDTGVIRGFTWPDSIVLAAANEVQGQVLLEGKVHRADMVLPSGSSSGELDLACQAEDGDGVTLRDRGLIVQGLASVR